MIEFRTGDIVQSDVEALVNTVNCVGVMGRGIALAFKEAFPENFHAYEAACRRGGVCPGHMFVVELTALTHPRWIINFPTKRHWRGKSRMEDIESGLLDLVNVVRERSIRSIAVPPLGSGLGGLNWHEVKPKIVSALRSIPELQAIIYEPGGRRDESIPQRHGTPPQMTVARAVLILSMRRYLSAMLDPTVSLLELHKILFFLQQAGEPLQLEYVKAHYGPYAENLRFLLQKMNHYYVETDVTQGDVPDLPIELVPKAVEDANEFLAPRTETRNRLDRVFELIDGWETPHGLELLATAYWLVAEENVTVRGEIVRQTYAWNERKRQFTPRQIELALDTLNQHGWITGSSHLTTTGA